MKNFLVTYDRKSGVASVDNYDSLAEANEARILAEDAIKGDVEIVALSADSIESLHISHSRYFDSVSEILSEMHFKTE